MKNNKSIIATPFFKQLISEAKSCDFLVDKSKCLNLFKHLSGLDIESSSFRSIKLSLFLKEYREPNQYYPCILIKENFSWISCDEKGEYRYFSAKPDGRVFVFDILDLMQINYGMNYKQLMDFFKKGLFINIKNEFLRAESEKYIDNIEKISQIEKKDSVLKSVLKNKEDVYSELNRIGLENLFSKTLSYEKNAIFFASTSYIQKRLDYKYSSSTINKVINMFSTIGLINKIQEQDIPMEFREGNVKKVKNFTSYYSIVDLKENIDYCEKRAKVLHDNNLTYYNLTKKKVLDVFGNDVYEEVYVQKTYEGKYNSGNEEKLLLDIFFDVYKERGYVSKELFYELSPSTYSKTFVFSKFDSIVKENGFRMVKPNNRLKNRFSLVNNTSIAIKY